MTKPSFTRLSCASLPVLFSLITSQSSYAIDAPVIVVTPSSVEQSRQLTSTPVTVINTETIKNSNASNLTELLRGHAGLHVSDFFGDGSQASIDLRGFGPTAGSNTLILVDGRRLNNSTDTAAPDLSAIDIENIQQIEIMQGSGGVLYGHQAVGGVINIITKKDLQDKATLKLDVGSYQNLKLSVSLQKRIGQTQMSILANDSSSENYRDNNDTDKQHAALKLLRQHDSFSAYVELQTTDEKIHTPGALLQAELDEDRTQSLSFYQTDYFDTQTDLVRIGIDKNLNTQSVINVDFSKRVNDREFIQSFRPFAGSLSTQDRDTSTFSGKYILQPQQDNGLVLLTTGFNLEQTDYELVSSIGPQSSDQTIYDAYVSTEWSLSSQGQLQAGVRVSKQSADLSNTEFDFVSMQNDAVLYDTDETISVGSLGYSWRVNDWKLYARAEQNFRYPTVEESTNVSLSQTYPMKPQQGISLEMGTEYFADNSHYRATLYAIELENEIAFDTTGFSNLNLDETRRNGLILEAINDWSDKFSTSLSLTYLDAEITDGGFKGNELPQVPEQTVRVGGTYQFNSEVLSGIELIVVSRQTFGGDFANQLASLPAYNVMNAHLSYDYKNWGFSFRINNVLDEKYSEKGSQFTEYDPVTFAPTNHEAFYPSPERNFWLSASYSF